MVSSAMDFTFKFDWIQAMDFDTSLLKDNETRFSNDSCNQQTYKGLEANLFHKFNMNKDTKSNY